MMKTRYRRLFGLMMALAVCILPILSGIAAQTEAAVQAGSVQYAITDSGFLLGLQTIVPMAGNQLLTANLLLKTAADATVVTNPEQLLLAVDEAGRAYTPLLFNGDSAFTASLQPGEKVMQVLFEIPKVMGNYDLAVLTDVGGETAGRISLGKSIGPVSAETDVQLATITADGYNAVIHGVTQSRMAYLDEAPQGMKYVWIDVTFMGAGTQASVSELAEQWILNLDGKAQVAVIPTRANNLLALINARFNDQLPYIRGKICFLVPEKWTELTGLAVGQLAINQQLPISGDLKKKDLAELDEDGAYHQAGWKATIQGMRLADKGKLADPPAGNKYVIVSLTVANQSTQNLSVSSELAFAMTDTQGNELTQAWFADLADTLDASMLPSESIKGEVAFLLPDGAQAGTFRVHLNMLGEPLLIDAAGYLAK